MLFWQPIKALAQMFNQVSNNLSGASRVFEILDEKSYILDSPQAIELPKIKGEVEFKNVSFSYPDDKESLIIEDINFTVKAGERIALVGPTGAGKTTIINLLSRFYDPIKGSILVDGYNIKELSTTSLRKQLGIMTQDSFLFSGTIKENLTYGCENVSDEAIVNACKTIRCHSFISKLQSGYDTLISSLTLSMGQKQLLALARTLIKDPRILILDEATSNIDTQTELLVQNGISKLMSGRTCFIVAHRLSTIKNSDRIFVLDDNKIIEEGSHDELIKLNGFYTMLYNSQFEGGIN